MDTTSSHALAATAFTEVISIYQERVQSGGLGPFTVGSQVGGRQEQPSTYASTSDFIADVELTARRELNRAELGYFNKFIKTGVIVSGKVPMEVAYHYSMEACIAFTDTHIVMESKMGAAFIQRGIYPLLTYAAPSPKYQAFLDGSSANGVSNRAYV